MFSILLSSFQNSYSQFPTYRLDVKNFVLVNQYRITFDIVLTHTNSSTMQYAGGQYFLKIPQSFGSIGIGNGVNSGYQYDSADGTPISDFPMNMIPRNPSVAAAIINGIPSYELRLAANSIPGAGNGLFLPEGIPLKVIKMKLKSATPFNFSYFSLAIRDSCSDNPLSLTRTKINGWIDYIGTEFTRCANHFVDTTFINSIVNCNIKFTTEGLYNISTDKLNKRDTATAYFRNVNSPYQIIDSSLAIIDTITLTGNFNFFQTPAGVYYIVVKNKNSIETWSKQGGENLTSGINNYDFTALSSQAYGENMVLKGSVYCTYSGNINNDMIIDVEDLLYVDNDSFNYLTGNSITDLNGDYLVDVDDLRIVDRNTRNYVSVERPGVLSNKNTLQ